MDISKAKKVVELTKENRKILVTFFEGNVVSSCVEEETKKSCETCQCDNDTCQEWIESLKGKGYEATEIELGELGIEESLPRFMAARESVAKPEEPAAAEPEAALTTEPEVSLAAESEVKPEVEEKSAVSETD